MTTILGISAFYHDSAAAILVDGEIRGAVQEERFTRQKHDYSFPTNAITYCLEHVGIEPSQLDYVCFYDKPLLKFERLLETYLAYAPLGFRSFAKAMPLWLGSKLHLAKLMRKGLQNEYKRRFIFSKHHESHAASAFYPSPHEEAAILTLDGVGEWTTMSLGSGHGNRIQLTHGMRFPHSLGLLYSAFTYFTGFKVNSGEYKLMGLAPYGEPKYSQLMLDKLIDLKADGSFRLDMSYFRYCQGLTMTSRKMNRLFGRGPRNPEAALSESDMDIAASIQAVTEEIMLRTARHLYEMTKLDNLCMAGGVALNCVGNGRILREGPFKNVWIQPAAGDAGGALGAALFAWHQLLGKERVVDGTNDLQKGSLLGPSYTTAQVSQVLDDLGANYTILNDENELAETVASHVADEMVVGLFSGRMEFGPRALGSRSILGNPESREMQSTMNLKIKFRESFRPFAPVVLREHVHKWFQMRVNEDSPYMLLVAPVLAEHRIEQNSAVEKGLDRLKSARSMVPAITHVDYSARVQTVDKVRNERLYSIIHKFYEQTGCPMMINTSFNIRGEPIVCTPQDAFRCFMGTDMDVLVMENSVLLKKEQQNDAVVDIVSYQEEFVLD